MKRYIVIVDDDALVRQSFRDCLESGGYQVEAFSSAEELLAAKQVKDAACLILDVQLPGISGLELQKKLTDGEVGVPIIFVSAHAIDANRELAGLQGAQSFLSKPVRREELLNAVMRAIRR